MWRPKFDTIYSGEWPYEPWHGVGLRFTGMPTNINGIVQMMWMSFSCNTEIGNQIIRELISTGYRDVTVIAYLNLDKLSEDLKEFGVTLSIIPPKP